MQEIRRAAPTIIAFCIAEGFQVSNYQNIWLAYGLWSLAILLGLQWAADYFKAKRAPQDDIEKFRQTADKFYPKESWFKKRFRKNQAPTPLSQEMIISTENPNTTWHPLHGIRTRVEQADPEFISMRDAAHKLYTAAHISKSIWAKAAEEMSGSGVTRGSPEDLLNYIATHISTRISIYGKKAPSDAFGKISNDDVRASFFDEGATKLKDKFYDKSLYWTDLAVKSEDLNDLIADLQVQSGFDSHKS